MKPGASGRRTIALVLAGCVVFAGLAALRHETTVAHVHAAVSGALEHAHALADFHVLSTTPHLHGRNVETGTETGECTLLAALAHATIVPDSLVASAIARWVAVVGLAAVAFEPPARAVYRLAPKTSPPATA